MTHLAKSFRVATATAVITLAVRPAVAEITSYKISPGSEYTYLASPMGPGIPGGMPSDYVLDFGIAGTFDVETKPGRMGQPATLNILNANLLLTGNELVQADPPAFGEVTADRVANFLEARNFLNLPQGAIVFADETFPLLRVMLENIGGDLSLFGGFDSMPVDGTGLEFNLRATPVPEPTTCVAAAMGAVLLVTAGRRQRSS